MYNIKCKKKNKKNATLSDTVPKSIRKIVDIGKIDTPNTEIHDSLFSRLGTGTSIKSKKCLFSYI